MQPPLNFSHNQTAALGTDGLFHKTKPTTFPLPSTAGVISGNVVAVTFGVKVAVGEGVFVEVDVASGMDVSGMTVSVAMTWVAGVEQAAVITEF